VGMRTPLESVTWERGTISASFCVMVGQKRRENHRKTFYYAFLEILAFKTSPVRSGCDLRH
jgi:hypothetical protein